VEKTKSLCDRQAEEIKRLKETIEHLERSNKELQDGEEIYRALFEHAGFSISLKTPENNDPFFYNKTEYESLGYTKEEYEQITDAELVVDTLEERKKHQKMMEEKGSIVFETKHKAKNGDIHNRLVSSVSVLIKGQLCHLNIGTDITYMKKVETELKAAHHELETRVQQRTLELQDKTRQLMESNTALKVLLEKRDDVIRDVEKRLLENTKQRVLPHLDNLKISPLNERQMLNLVELEANLNDILSPFLKRLSYEYHGLTPTEIRVAAYIREGKSSKEIAEIFSVAAKTIDVHRNHLRKKLGIANKKINLQSYLRSLDIPSL
jgi:PAS domain S-box-containing protein